MNCVDLEALLCEYLDGTLAAEARAEVEEHLARCENCAALARDAGAAVEFLGRAEAVEPPPALMTRILFELNSQRERKRQPGGFTKLVQGWFQTIRQPRFAMGFALTILSFSLLGKLVGFEPRQLTLDDLKPARVWQSLDDRVYRAWQRTVKFYENLRLVYEVQTQIKEWKQREQELRGRTANEEQTTPPPAARQPGTTGARPQSQAPNGARNERGNQP